MNDPRQLRQCAADDAWPRARNPLGTAIFRGEPADFQVAESLSFSPTGAGEFVLVRVRKVDRNTADVARELADHAGVSARAVSWAGRKDRRAVARQWFSVHLPGRADPDWSAAGAEGWTVEHAERHRRKLRAGALAANRFVITLRDVGADASPMTERARELAAAGVPNYFGPQRFGRGGSNLLAAASGRRLRRNERSLALSAARSALFNAVLAERVAARTWDTILPGEVPMLAASRAIFGPETDGEALAERAGRGEIDPTGPLWGPGTPRAVAEVAELEATVIDRFPELTSALEAARAAPERRRLRLMPRDLTLATPGAGIVELRFELEPGTFATSVLREFFDIRSAPRAAE
ncbi:MAG: tRNA pseudouridine(13) synthase TruD [Pseudomonadota bacterium]